MDNQKIENLEQTEQSFQKETEMAESKIRSLDRSNSQRTEVVDKTMTDKAGRPITLRSWENEKGVMVRAYDTAQSQVPETPNLGQAGHATAHFDQSIDDSKRLRLNYIETNGEYRGSGIGGKMLSQVEEYGLKNGATEIYGVIENPEAQNFWESQADNGWEIDYSQGAYGYARKVMS